MNRINKKELISKRIFFDPSNEDFEYSIIGLDKYGYLFFGKYIYGHLMQSKIYLIAWLKEQGIEIEKLHAEEFVGHFSKPRELSGNETEFELEFHKKIVSLGRKSESDYFNFLTAFINENRAIELKDGFIYSNLLGLFVKTNFGTYEAKRFDPVLEGVIETYIENGDSVSQVEEAYEFFFLNHHKLKPKIIEELNRVYKIYKEEALENELDEWEKSFYPEVKHPEEIRKIIEYSSLSIILDENENFSFTIYGSCTWDEEHGFAYNIDKDLNIDFH